MYFEHPQFGYNVYFFEPSLSYKYLIMEFCMFCYCNTHNMYNVGNLLIELPLQHTWVSFNYYTTWLFYWHTDNVIVVPYITQYVYGAVMSPRR